MELPSGKAPPWLLDAVASAEGGAVLQGPGPGRDAAVIEWGGELLVVTSDPITFVDTDAARLAVAVNANDIFAVGAEPEYLLAAILAPVGVQSAELRSLLLDLQSACSDAGIALVGGHTEVTDAVTRTLISCTMIGRAARESLLPSDGAQAGDAIVQAGAAAVEGTAILGHPELLQSPGISIASAARALREVAGVHAMHDVTEGGIATASLELAEAAGLAAALVYESIIWLPQTLEVCAERGLDPLGLLGSGALLAAVAPESVDAALAALSAAGVDGSVIGTAAQGIRATLSHGGQSRPLARFERDEALRAFDDARRSTE